MSQTTKIPGVETKTAVSTSDKVVVGTTHQSQPDHSGPVHVALPRGQSRAVIPASEDTGRSLYMLRFYDGALMRFTGTEWVVEVEPIDDRWAEEFFPDGYSVPCVLHPLGSDLFAAWHLPNYDDVGITISGFFRDGAFVQVAAIEGTPEQLAWSNPINYRGKIRWMGASASNGNLIEYEADASGVVTRRDVVPDGTEWFGIGVVTNDVGNQLSVGGFIEPHNEKLHLGTTTFSSNGTCDEDPLILDRRMFLDPFISVQTRPVPLRALYSAGRSFLSKPYSDDFYDYLARTMLGQASFKGQMFYISIEGKLYWQDDLRYTMKEIYDLSHEVEAFDPGVTVVTTGTEDAGKEKAAWSEQQDFYQSVFPFDFLCRIDFKNGDFTGKKALNTGRQSCGALADENGCVLLTEDGASILADDAPYGHFIETEKVRNIVKSLPDPLADEIDLPSTEEACRTFYQIPAATELGVAFALAGCTDNVNNVSNPATVLMFEHGDALWVVISSGTKTRGLNRPPSVLIKFTIDMDPESWLDDGPTVTSHEETLLTENGTPLNVSGMVPILDAKAGLLHLLYEDPELKQLKHLEVRLSVPRQTYRGVVCSTERAMPPGYLVDARSALTQGCAVDYHGDESFIFITKTSLRADHKAVQIDYVAYSPSSTPISVTFRHAIGTLDRGFRGEKPGFVPTTALVSDPQHQTTDNLATSPTGVHHRFVHNLEADGLDTFTGDIQYEAHPRYAD